VIPGRGRGTLRIVGTRLIVELPGAEAEVQFGQSIESREALAAAVEQGFGSAVTLVGKAVALPTMFCREGAMLLHEGASGYVRLTREMVRQLAEGGQGMEFHPIVRLHHATWDALAGSDVQLRLPPHLAAAFRRTTVSGAEFAGQWRGAMEEALAFLAELERTRKPGDIASLLAKRHPEYSSLLPAFADACCRLREIGRRIQALRDEHEALLRDLRRLRREGSAGRPAARDLQARCAQMRQRIADMMRSEEYRAARAARDEALYAIQLAHLRAVRDAYYVLALEHANHRPSWWWFPLVDPSGRWFCQAAERAELYLEEMPG
jgi:hypothetical protein